jgi:hypothetical protein
MIEEKCNALFKEFRLELEKDFISRMAQMKEEMQKASAGLIDSNSEKPDNNAGGQKVNKHGGVDTANLLSEVTDRDRRKSNLVWFGVPECNSEDAHSRKTEDTKFVKGACTKALGVEVEIVACKRLRSQSKQGEGSKRPLLVTLIDPAQVGLVLKEARKLRDSEDFKDVFIKKDSTPLERAEMKKLITMRDQKREETKTKGGDENWVIRNGKVVNIARRSRQEGGEARK